MTGVGMKRRRFTQGELVVVLGIVGVLLGAVVVTGPRQWHGFPSVGSLGDPCKNHLRNIGNAIVLYSCDAKGACPGPVPSASFTSWDQALLPELSKSYPPRIAGFLPMAFFCPEDRTAWGPVASSEFAIYGIYPFVAKDSPSPSGWGFSITHAMKNPLHRSYSLNLGAAEFSPTADQIPASAVVEPAGTVQLCDFHDELNLFGDPGMAGRSKDEFLSKMFSGKSTRSSRLNALFHDGHIETMDDARARADDGKIFKYTK